MSCTTCADVGRKGYCAPLRCYCGHPTCHGYPSYVQPAPPEFGVVKPARPNAWANREESTWIDQM